MTSVTSESQVVISYNYFQLFPCLLSTGNDERVVLTVWSIPIAFVSCHYNYDNKKGHNYNITVSVLGLYMHVNLYVSFKRV